MTIDAFITQTEVGLNMRFTDEQRDFIVNMTTPGMCFASPGTGKTASATAGLITAEMFRGIPGDQIFALSFTNMATLELSVRHAEACGKLGCTQRVVFKTLHKMCTGILKENYTLLGMDRLTTEDTFSIERLSGVVLSVCREHNINMEPRRVRNVIRAIRTLNSSLDFEKENVETRVCFKDTGLNYEDFQLIRWELYNFNKQLERIQVDDIMLYTLELLLTHPEVAEKFKKTCRVMLVDEAQDLSLLQLRIITLLTDCPVLIGDIKQQIYAFNGACQEIVAQYYKYFPKAWKKQFTRSFRCRNEIAAFATKLITPNHVGGEDFTGVGNGGIVTVDTGIDYSSICKKINETYLENKRNFPQSILFLFRNNYMVIPLAEEFFKLKTPFRVNKYVPITKMVIMVDLCAIVDLAVSPNSLEDLEILSKLIPEFRGYNSVNETPFYRYMKKNHCSIFDLNYDFKDQYNGELVMGMMLEVHDMCSRNAPAADIFNKIYPIYHTYWLGAREMFMEYDPQYYLNLASYSVRGKSYRQFKQDEIEKSKAVEDFNNRRIGVRCYTFHAAKGLEADVVYMVDCDEKAIPNQHRLNEMLKKGCELDAARTIRNERSLVYVSATRAKEELHIYYNEDLSSLLTPENAYQKFDMLYETYKQSYDDIRVFQEFCAKGGQ